jgi:hypothetical protein
VHLELARCARPTRSPSQQRIDDFDTSRNAVKWSRRVRTERTQHPTAAGAETGDDAPWRKLGQGSQGGRGRHRVARIRIGYCPDQ